MIVNISFIFWSSCVTVAFYGPFFFFGGPLRKKRTIKGYGSTANSGEQIKQFLKRNIQKCGKNGTTGAVTLMATRNKYLSGEDVQDVYIKKSSFNLIHRPSCII